MKNRTLIAIGLLLASALPVSAYHIQGPPFGPGNGVWTGAEDQLVLCESNGWWDSINFDPAPHVGVGGNCYYWLMPVAAGLAGDASLPAGTCTQSTLAGAIPALELTPGCQNYTYKVKPTAKWWWCVDNTLTVALLPPGPGGKVPTRWGVGGFQMQGDSKGMCFDETYAWYEGSHIVGVPAMAWSEPFPLGTVGFGNIPGNTGRIASWLGPVLNNALPPWCTAGGHHPKILGPATTQTPSPMCVDEATVAASLYV